VYIKNEKRARGMGEKDGKEEKIKAERATTKK
jgi:hypothetical protein